MIIRVGAPHYDCNQDILSEVNYGLGNPCLKNDRKRLSEFQLRLNQKMC
jgi:hypothetical protein